MNQQKPPVQRSSSPKEKVPYDLYEEGVHGKGLFVQPIRVCDTELTVMGLQHGHGETAPMREDVVELISEELKKEKGLVLSEDFAGNDQFGVDVINIDEKGPLARYVLGDASGEQLQDFASLMAVGTLIKDREEMNLNLEKSDGIPPVMRLSNESLLNGPTTQSSIKLFGSSPQEVVDGIKLVSRVRTLMMAANTIEVLRDRQPESASVMMGSGHMTDFIDFIQHPDKARRYCALTMERIQKHGKESGKEVDDFMGDLESALGTFGKEIELRA